MSIGAVATTHTYADAEAEMKGADIPFRPQPSAPVLADLPPIATSSTTVDTPANASKKLRISGVALSQLGALALGIQTGLICAGFAASSIGLGIAGAAIILGLFLIAFGHREKSVDEIASIVTTHAALALATFVSSLVAVAYFIEPLTSTPALSPSNFKVIFPLFSICALGGVIGTILSCRKAFIYEI